MVKTTFEMREYKHFPPNLNIRKFQGYKYHRFCTFNYLQRIDHVNIWVVKPNAGKWRCSANVDIIWRYSIKSNLYSFYLHTYIPERMLYIMIWTLNTCHILLNQMIDNYTYICTWKREILMDLFKTDHHMSKIC